MCGVDWHGLAVTGRARVRTVAALAAGVVLAWLVLGSSAAQAVQGPVAIGVHRLSGDVYEYDYQLSTGAGPFHEVGVHRVVEVRNGRAIAARDGVFLVHGDAWNFDGAFRGGLSPSESIAVFLATKGIDVWGVDLGWTLVPASTTDFSFMRGWGLQRDINDVESALRFARTIRAQTESSGNQLALLTWSRGGWIGYGLLNEESQMPAAERQVRAFIPVDTYFKVSDPVTRANACGFANSINEAIASGTYENSNETDKLLGRLADQAPNDVSPVFGPPFTNLQASLEFGAAAWRLGGLITPWYHFVAGVFPGGTTDDLPTGLLYTTVEDWNSFLRSASPFETLALVRDTWAISCSLGATGPFDDHLGDITVPVLYVGAGGGVGRAGLYSLSLLGSSSISTQIVSFVPESQARFDFGHVDLFYAGDAAQLVWSPIAAWLQAHSRTG
jgi:hypothetical protein